MLKLEERPSNAKPQKLSERKTKAQHFRALARGYEALKKNKATAYRAAAEALEQIERRESR